jgi:hypothetical protein
MYLNFQLLNQLADFYKIQQGGDVTKGDLRAIVFNVQTAEYTSSITAIDLPKMYLFKAKYSLSLEVPCFCGTTTS